MLYIFSLESLVLSLDSSTPDRAEQHLAPGSTSQKQKGRGRGVARLARHAADDGDDGGDDDYDDDADTICDGSL